MFNIYDEVAEASSIAVGGHIRPDGDCVGSCMSMYLFLKKVFPEKKVDVYLDKPSDIFNCIKGTDSESPTTLNMPDSTRCFVPPRFCVRTVILFPETSTERIPEP